MVPVNLDNLKNFEHVPFPIIVCQHLSISDKVEFNGRSIIVGENPKALLIRSSGCQCDILFKESANMHNFDALLQDRSIDLNARMATFIGCQAWGPNDVVHWYCPLLPRDQNILDKLTWYLGQDGFDINQAVNADQETLLHQFCRQSCSPRQRYIPAPVSPFEVVKFLLNKGARLDTRDYQGNTPLHLVSHSGGNSTLMALLLESANGNLEIINAVNNEGVTALTVALRSTSWLGKALLLLRAGASTEKHANGNSPLHYLICSGRVNTESLELLIHFGADVYGEYGKGALPIIDMAGLINNHDYRCLPCIFHLIKMGVALNRVDHRGQSLLSELLSLDDPDDNGKVSCFAVSKDDKLDICDAVLKAWYKYNFPEKAEGLKGAICDSLIENREADLAQLLADYPDAFYLVDNTVEIIGSNLSKRNKHTLESMLEKARDKHPEDASLLPFVYMHPESFEYGFGPHSSASERAAIYSASLSDFVRLGLDLNEGDAPIAEDDDIEEEGSLDEGVEPDTSIFEEENAPAGNLAIQLSDIQIYDWLIEARFESFRRLLMSHQSLYNVISIYEVSLTDRLSLENKEKLHTLLADIGSKRGLEDTD